MIQKEEIAMKTDAELQQHVMDELKWEPTIHAAEIGVAVKDGVVTLSCNVDSYVKKWAAGRAAKRVFWRQGSSCRDQGHAGWLLQAPRQGYCRVGDKSSRLESLDTE